MTKTDLAKKSVAQLKALAKKNGANVKNSDGSAKTKEQLVNAVFMASIRSKKAGTKKTSKTTLAAKSKTSGTVAIKKQTSGNRAFVARRSAGHTIIVQGTVAQMEAKLKELVKMGYKKVPIKTMFK